MAWLLPAALAGLLLLAAPLLVHMLTRRRAQRVPFPAVRFAVAAHATAVRVRRPADLALLLVRSGVVLCAVLAAAQPLLLTPWRVKAWDGRVARVILVDSSESMRGSRDSADAIARAESSSAFQATRIDTPDLRDGLLRAVRALSAPPPARREIVVVSDFQVRAIGAADLAPVPSTIGLRFVRAGRFPERREVEGSLVDGWQRATWRPSVTVTPSSTSTTWRRASGDADLGVALVAPAGAEATAAAALRAAASFGAVVEPARRIRIIFAKAVPVAAQIEAPHTRWIIETVLALRRSGARGAIARAGEKNGELVIESSAPVDSVAAAALIREALAARGSALVDPEADVTTAGDAELSRWQRNPAPVDPAAWRHVERTDARWFWIGALLLLGVESWMRRRPAVTREERPADAAAA